jgi:hypothetical protein
VAGAALSPPAAPMAPPCRLKGAALRSKDFSGVAFRKQTDNHPNYYRAINNTYNDFALVAGKVELFLFMQVIRESA